MRFELYSGADNRFLLTEASVELHRAPALARRLCSLSLFEDHAPDGLLVLQSSGQRGAQMTIYNADGSRPEACGNGLRCVGWHLARTLGGTHFTIETDAGPRLTRVESSSGGSAKLYTGMGSVTTSPLPAPWPQASGLLAAHQAHVGNPHCVLVVEDERNLDSRALGEALQSHPSFSAGVNVGLFANRDNGLHLRVFERGVGETSACGTGACAAAACITNQPAELEIQMRGGVLRVRLDSQRHAELLGQATFHGSLELEVHPPETDSWATCSRS